jgi:ATP-dependent DNA helicase DinG
MNQTPTPVPLSAEAQRFIDSAYERLQHALPDFIVRDGQRLLSEDICRSFVSRVPLAAEAPTGTGKTLAYLIGALAARQGVQGVLDPIVVATATKALQAQLMLNDLPKLVAAGALTPDAFAIAKGKGNYVCLRDAQDVQRLGQSILNDHSEDEVPDESAQIDPVDVDQMVYALEDGTWDGDFDAYMGPKPSSLDRIKVKSETCTGKKCQHYNRCAYYQARAKMATAQVIVANQDLVLADLQMHAEEQEPYFPARTYMLVVDEAHNFPDKAISVGQKTVNVVDTLNRVGRLRALWHSLERHKEFHSVLERAKVTKEDFEAKSLVKALQEMLRVLDETEVDDATGQLRYPRGVVPTDLKAACVEAGKAFTPVTLAVGAVLSSIKETNPPEHVALRKSLAEATHIAVKAGHALREAALGLAAFEGAHRAVRWISKADGRLCVHASPLEGADVLRPLLWASSRTLPVFVSATLRDLDGFGLFKRACGMPAHSTYKVLPFIFPYAESQLVVAAMHATPKMAERSAYLAELRKKLPAAIRADEATLVLAPSRVLLRELAPVLKANLGEDVVLVQGDASIKALLERHKRRVAAGQPSVLVGMATMAEGLDLPGKLCEHVVILALPFAVPTEPVEQELAEMLGSKYFGERSLPDAMTRLLQMVGRLLRRESDRGRVTLFDRRLVSTSYGKRMLAALPPFKRVIEPLTVTA